MTRIKIIDESKAQGRLKEIYTVQQKYGIKMASIYKAQSLKPSILLAHIELHAELINSHSEITRAEKELIIVIVSLCNGCAYSQFRHADFLNLEWKDEAKIIRVFNDYTQAGLTPREIILCDFAKHLTMMPEDFENPRYIENLKKTGFSDDGILDIVLISSYANYINRIALALDLDPELITTNDSESDTCA
ncbi:MAG: peroxidase-related enzyme [Bacteroidetes bacterium]|nr:peroxidase-related enzyme [Bacteroidota bacterium]